MNRTAPQEVMAFLSACTPEVQNISLSLRSLIYSVAPEITEQVDIPAKMIAYILAKTYKDMLCVIMPLKDS